MSLAYLNNGATSFAAANWDDAAGFTTNAELVAKVTATITAGLDQSAVVTGINRLLIPRLSTGSIGTAVQGALIVDIDDVVGEWSSANPTRARLEVFAAGGQYYFRAGGGSSTISNTFIDTQASVFFGGGTFTTTRHSSGTLAIDATTILGTFWIWGPASVVIEPRATSLTTFNSLGGNSLVMRAATTVNIYGGVYRLSHTVGTTTTVNIYGGTLIHEAGDITTVNGFAGEYRPVLARAATIATFNRELPFRFSRSDPLLTITNDIRFNPGIV